MSQTTKDSGAASENTNRAPVRMRSWLVNMWRVHIFRVSKDTVGIGYVRI